MYTSSEVRINGIINSYPLVTNVLCLLLFNHLSHIVCTPTTHNTTVLIYLHPINHIINMSSSAFTVTVIEGRTGASTWEPTNINTRFVSREGADKRRCAAVERRAAAQNTVVARVAAHHERVKQVRRKDETSLRNVLEQERMSGAEIRREERRSAVLSRVGAHHERVKQAHRPSTKAARDRMLARHAGADARRADMRAQRLTKLSSHHEHVQTLRTTKKTAPEVEA